MRAINNHWISGQPKYKAVLREDRLIVNGKYYTVDNLDKLPEEISTAKLATPRKNNMVAFFSKN